jgi:pimeloyl-ACP methyl ester carboxylesterase
MISKLTRRSFTGLMLLVSLQFAAADEVAGEPRPDPPGKLVDVGGFRLHIWCMGKESESPAVVLIPGAGDFSFTWGLVQPEVAKFTRVCSFDAAGEAWSDNGPGERTFKQQAYELRLLLRAAGVKGPYVLVGASIGGIIARVFAHDYRGDVAGMVLVDSTDPDTVLGTGGKPTRVRETSKGRTVPPVQTMKSSPPRMHSATELEQWASYLDSMGKPAISEPHNLLPPKLQKLDVWARFLEPRERLRAEKSQLAAVLRMCEAFVPVGRAVPSADPDAPIQRPEDDYNELTPACCPPLIAVFAKAGRFPGRIARSDGCSR